MFIPTGTVSHANTDLRIEGRALLQEVFMYAFEPDMRVGDLGRLENTSGTLPNDQAYDPTDGAADQKHNSKDDLIDQQEEATDESDSTQ